MNAPRFLPPLVSCLFLLASAGCSDPPADEGGTEPKTVLRVPLYPYIPDSAGDKLNAMARRIEAEYEATHPDVDLVVNPTCFKDDVYDPAALAKGLSDEASECAYDLVEIDTSLLGEMVETGAIRPFSALPQGVDWHPSSITSSTYNGELFGVPHWMCGHFIFSRHEAVQKAGTASALVQALDALQTPAPNMAGNMLGSWNLPSLYLDAWADTNGPEGVASAVSTADYDTSVLQDLRRFAGACEDPSGNPCIDGAYDLEENFDLPAERFAAGEADAMFGYSERIHTIVKALGSSPDSAPIRISSAPLGNGNQPILFTDSFVVSKQCVDRCADAAAAFVAYMSSKETYEWILTSEDAAEEGRVPRYLMPASLDAYTAPKIAQDPYYTAINAETKGGGSFPNVGILDKREEMRDEILNAIEAPQP